MDYRYLNMLAALDRSQLNTVLALFVPAVLAFFFAVVLWVMKRRYDNRQDALNKSYEAERQASRLEHDNERREAEERQRRMDAMADGLEALNTRQAVIDSQVVPLSALYQSLLIQKLTHLHEPRTDALMIKQGDHWTPPTTTDAELSELILALKARTRDMGPGVSEDERDAARALPAVMRMAKREADRVAAGTAYVEIATVGILHEGENGPLAH